MQFSPSQLYIGQPSTSATQLTSTVSGKILIKHIVVCNTTASAATITIGANATATDVAARRLLSAVSVSANSSLFYDCNVVIESPNLVLYGLQGTASALTVHVYGVVIS